MQEQTITRTQPTQAGVVAIEEESAGGLAEQAAAFAHVARQSAEACRQKDAQKELDRRQNRPGE